MDFVDTMMEVKPVGWSLVRRIGRIELVAPGLVGVTLCELVTGADGFAEHRIKIRQMWPIQDWLDEREKMTAFINAGGLSGMQVRPASALLIPH